MLYLAFTTHRMLGVFNAKAHSMHYPILMPEQLPAMLRSLRQRAGLTQAQLAERLGISQQSYARLEASPAATSVARLSKLLRVLNAELVIHTRDDQPTAVSDEAW